MWDRTMINMGTVRENAVLSFSFFHTGGVTEVTVEPSCSCTNAKWSADKNAVIGSIHVGKFPVHLRKQGMKTLDMVKTIVVSYTENNQKKKDVLIIKALLT